MSQISSIEATAVAAVEAQSSPHRRKLFLALGAVVVAAGIGYGTYWSLYASHFVSTDNAYAAVEIAQVTPSVGGTVLQVKVVDTQAVRKGDELVVIDDTDARLALAQAEAGYASAVRRVRGFHANDEGLSAQIASREADQGRAAAQLQAAEADFERAQIDLKRREALAGSGSVSGEELDPGPECVRDREGQPRGGPRRLGPGPAPTAPPRSARAKPMRY